MSYEEIQQAEENDRKDWLADGEARAFADEPCDVCGGTGYTNGVTVRHRCVVCNFPREFRVGATAHGVTGIHDAESSALVAYSSDPEMAALIVEALNQYEEGVRD